jgi:hypothetical protein
MIRSVVDENGFFLKNTTPRPSGANLDDCRDADHVFAGAASAVPPRRRLCAAWRLCVGKPIAPALPAASADGRMGALSSEKSAGVRRKDVQKFVDEMPWRVW